MSTYPSLNKAPTPNFPQPLNRNESYNLTFPSDILNNDKRKFYTQIQFMDYSIYYQFSYTVTPTPSGGVKLPIPLKVDDNYVLQWSTISGYDFIPNIAAKAAGLIANPITGAALNPLLFMQFQRPEYRSFSLSWVLSPRNEKESKSIKDIITECKRAAAPELAGFGTLLTYPKIAIIKMHPDNLFGHMVFKPCIITSVQANYTGSPNPAFFKNGAPAVVTLTLNLQELQFWYRGEIT